MIVRLVSGEDGLTFEAALARGGGAYVDGDWLPSEPGGEVPALVLDPAGVDPDARAAQALTRVARESVAHVEGRSGAVDVTGAGLVAAIARQLLGGRVAAPGAAAPRPEAVIDTTGDPDRIAAATRRVADLGLVVLAGESTERQLDLDLYPDVHVRGLELVGVTPMLVSDLEDDDDAPPVPAPAEVEIGAPLPRAAVWYRITGAAEH